MKILIDNFAHASDEFYEGNVMYGVNSKLQYSLIKIDLKKKICILHSKLIENIIREKKLLFLLVYLRRKYWVGCFRKTFLKYHWDRTPSQLLCRKVDLI